jgi:hypothetical protein
VCVYVDRLPLRLGEKDLLKQKQDEVDYLSRIASEWKLTKCSKPPPMAQELFDSKWWQEKLKLEEEAKR